MDLWATLRADLGGPNDSSSALTASRQGCTSFCHGRGTKTEVVSFVVGPFNDSRYLSGKVYNSEMLENMEISWLGLLTLVKGSSNTRH